MSKVSFKTSWLCVCLVSFTSLTACFSEEPKEAKGSEDLLSVIATPDSQEDQARAAEDMKSVEVYLQTGRSESSGASLALVSDVGSTVYNLAGCKSGYTTRITSYGGESLRLYRFDQNCSIQVESFVLRSVSYSLPVGQSFQPSIGAVNAFRSVGGDTVYLTVMSQLPSILDGSYYAANFVIAANREGLAITKSIYEVAISVDTPIIREDSSALVTFTVKRAAPATGSITVNLAYEGDATPGVDTSTPPMSITLSDGQGSQTFALSMSNDLISEPSELLRVRVKPGTNYFPKNIPADLTISDDDIAVLSSELVSYSFGSRALNLPHSISVKLGNSGRGPATLLQSSALSAPFSYPGGFPGDQGTCGNMLPPGQFCFLTIAFTPTVAVTSSATATISYFNTIDSSQTSFNLLGSGASRAYLRLSEQGIADFGTARAGETLKKHLRITNLGSLSASTLSASFSSPRFSFVGGSFPGTGGSCASTLAAGQQCTIVVAFTAGSIGYYDGSFLLSYNNGSQLVSQSLELAAAVNQLIVSSLSYTTASVTAVTTELKARGASGAVTYEILSPPRFGTLTGAAPQLSYKPRAGFEGIDRFVYRAIDSQGASDPGTIIIYVAPKAVFVAQKTSLNDIDTEVLRRLQLLGFNVAVQDDNGASFNDTYGRDLLLVSATSQASLIRNKYDVAPLPILVWNKTFYNDLEMVDSTFSKGTFSSSSIRISDVNHPIASGFPVGTFNVLTKSSAMTYINGSHPNLQKVAHNPSNTSQSVIFGYEEGTALPSKAIAQGRRLGTFLPESGSLLSSDGKILIDQSIEWMMQGSSDIFMDSFQRDPSLSLGRTWQENESTGPAALQIAGDQLAFETGATASSAKIAFEMQTTGQFTWTFTLDLAAGAAAPANYLLDLQLGRCDLMDKNLPFTSGAGVHLVWGGNASGLNAEASLGYRRGNTVTSLGLVNQRLSTITVSIDLGLKTYTVKLPNGATSAAIAFDNAVGIDCLRLSSQNINSQGFTYRALQDLRLRKGY